MSIKLYQRLRTIHNNKIYEGMVIAYSTYHVFLLMPDNNLHPPARALAHSEFIYLKRNVPVPFECIPHHEVQDLVQQKRQYIQISRNIDNWTLLKKEKCQLCR